MRYVSHDLQVIYSEEKTEEVKESTDGTQLADYTSGRKFVDFPLSQEILQGIIDHGFETATPIQAATIEIGLARKDIVARAKTGTGKTAAFAIPICELVDDMSDGPQALIMAPTRELAQQIAHECDAFNKHKGTSTAVLWRVADKPTDSRPGSVPKSWWARRVALWTT